MNLHHIRYESTGMNLLCSFSSRQGLHSAQASMSLCVHVRVCACGRGCVHACAERTACAHVRASGWFCACACDRSMSFLSISTRSSCVRNTSPPPLLSAPLLSERGTRNARGEPTMGEPRRPRGPTGRTRKPTKEVQGVHRETSEGAQKALRVGQTRRSTLPCLSQTGEGFLFVFDFHKN